MRIRSEKIRLTGKKEFDAVFSKKKLWTPDMVFYFLRNGLDYGRMGLVVSKRVYAGAVRRNRLKRRLRDLFRRFAESVGGFDIVVVAKKGEKLQDFSVLESRFEKLAGTLKKQPS